ncbi:Ceramide glucosyltransferase [Coemansia sp. RSA 2523]|nr:Ceramide glucosyltransferase [Coemansia sp. RSA 1591]KAJ1764981.1 Ceramide glucosyltransferase [Coemansia sp. RSA 1752]KAJ1808297.1 Ceramide glucosyltransferase [Coemansia sp. RSA 2523]KAJ2131753.1 Ceramide glucosyltransferase [Coemansia sp. RSA 921]KAJ2248945.1 Ceramide glucosyltransferase [Coemansia sp. RSA 475]KAJ2274262.1 Ceramide glucosyltransferase [Coemansia sp. RSA 451]KAJ2548428.1 Ceramide glucosyltransferase [Coemansia sp. RSA 1878]
MNAGAAHNSPGAGMPSVITAADATRMSLNSSLISANLAAYTILVLAAFQWLLIFVSHCVLQRRYVRRRPFVDRPTDDYPGVTIIRPVKGVDHGMQRTLESSFLQEYPGPVEILFAVEDPDDLAIEVISNIIARYPKVQARVLIGKDNVGINPKVNNMLKAFDQAQNDLLWICDSNVYTDPGTLRRSADLLLDNKRLGVIHHVVFSESPTSFAGMLDNAFLVTNHCRMYLAINAFGIASCLMGKSNLYYKSALDNVGGIASFGQYLAEDNMIGQALWHSGWSHTMTGDLARQPADIGSFSEYCSRRIRWVRTRKYNVTFATFYEPLTESILLGSLTSWALGHIFGLSIVATFTTFMSCWFALDMVFFYRINHESPPSWLWFVLSWLCREALALPLWVVAITGDTVVWRGQRFQFHLNGTVQVL